jgi:hypothetical protein
MKAIDASGKVEPRNWCFLKVSFFVWKTVGPLGSMGRITAGILHYILRASGAVIFVGTKE